LPPSGRHKGVNSVRLSISLSADIVARCKALADRPTRS
jgi:hypothetical protein